VYWQFGAENKHSEITAHEFEPTNHRRNTMNSETKHTGRKINRLMATGECNVEPGNQCMDEIVSLASTRKSRGKRQIFHFARIQIKTLHNENEMITKENKKRKEKFRSQTKY
jgi:hypothetical protein